jgi:beta-1,4-mannosyl-glycoprotein beta-1,4-N-acetylglucosaminyltransferase
MAIKLILGCLLTFSVHAKIYDAFPFFNELEILKIRLEELDPVVDYFVLVEAKKTFSGLPKPLYYDENKHLFKDFESKIIHIIVDSYNEEVSELEKSSDKKTQTWAAWCRERYQRNKMVEGFEAADDEDIILISDVDEIMTCDAVKEAKDKLNRGASIVSFFMELYKYQFNRKDLTCPNWWSAKAVKKKILKDYSPDYIRNIKGSNTPLVKRGGWHFSSIGNQETIIQKFLSYSHMNDFFVQKLKADVKANFQGFLKKHPKVKFDDFKWPKRIMRLKEEYAAQGLLDLSP